MRTINLGGDLFNIDVFNDSDPMNTVHNNQNGCHHQGNGVQITRVDQNTFYVRNTPGIISNPNGALNGPLPTLQNPNRTPIPATSIADMKNRTAKAISVPETIARHIPIQQPLNKQHGVCQQIRKYAQHSPDPNVGHTGTYRNNNNNSCHNATSQHFHQVPQSTSAEDEINYPTGSVRSQVLKLIGLNDLQKKLQPVQLVEPNQFNATQEDSDLLQSKAPPSSTPSHELSYFKHPISAKAVEKKKTAPQKVQLDSKNLHKKQVPKKFTSPKNGGINPDFWDSINSPMVRNIDEEEALDRSKFWVCDHKLWQEELDNQMNLKQKEFKAQNPATVSSQMASLSSKNSSSGFSSNHVTTIVVSSVNCSRGTILRSPNVFAKQALNNCSATTNLTSTCNSSVISSTVASATPSSNPLSHPNVPSTSAMSTESVLRHSKYVEAGVLDTMPSRKAGAHKHKVNEEYMPQIVSCYSLHHNSGEKRKMGKKLAVDEDATEVMKKIHARKMGYSSMEVALPLAAGKRQMLHNISKKPEVQDSVLAKTIKKVNKQLEGEDRFKKANRNAHLEVRPHSTSPKNFIPVTTNPSHAKRSRNNSADLYPDVRTVRSRNQNLLQTTKLRKSPRNASNSLASWFNSTQDSQLPVQIHSPQSSSLQQREGGTLIRASSDVFNLSESGSGPNLPSCEDNRENSNSTKALTSVLKQPVCTKKDAPLSAAQCSVGKQTLIKETRLNLVQSLASGFNPMPVGYTSLLDDSSDKDILHMRSWTPHTHSTPVAIVEPSFPMATPKKENAQKYVLSVGAGKELGKDSQEQLKTKKNTTSLRKISVQEQEAPLNLKCTKVFPRKIEQTEPLDLSLKTKKKTDHIPIPMNLCIDKIGPSSSSKSDDTKQVSLEKNEESAAKIQHGGSKEQHDRFESNPSLLQNKTQLVIEFRDKESGSGKDNAGRHDLDTFSLQTLCCVALARYQEEGRILNYSALDVNYELSKVSKFVSPTRSITITPASTLNKLGIATPSLPQHKKLSFESDNQYSDISDTESEAELSKKTPISLSKTAKSAETPQSGIPKPVFCDKEICDLSVTTNSPENLPRRQISETTPTRESSMLSILLVKELNEKVKNVVEKHDPPACDDEQSQRGKTDSIEPSDKTPNRGETPEEVQKTGQSNSSINKSSSFAETNTILVIPFSSERVEFIKSKKLTQQPTTSVENVEEMANTTVSSLSMDRDVKETAQSTERINQEKLRMESACALISLAAGEGNLSSKVMTSENELLQKSDEACKDPSTSEEQVITGSEEQKLSVQQKSSDDSECSLIIDEVESVISPTTGSNKQSKVLENVSSYGQQNIIGETPSVENGDSPASEISKDQEDTQVQDVEEHAKSKLDKRESVNDVLNTHPHAVDNQIYQSSDNPLQATSVSLCRLNSSEMQQNFSIFSNNEVINIRPESLEEVIKAKKKRNNPKVPSTKDASHPSVRKEKLDPCSPMSNSNKGELTPSLDECVTTPSNENINIFAVNPTEELPTRQQTKVDLKDQVENLQQIQSDDQAALTKDEIDKEDNVKTTGDDDSGNKAERNVENSGAGEESKETTIGDYDIIKTIPYVPQPHLSDSQGLDPFEECCDEYDYMFMGENSLELNPASINEDVFEENPTTGTNDSASEEEKPLSQLKVFLEEANVSRLPISSQESLGKVDNAEKNKKDITNMFSGDQENKVGNNIHNLLESNWSGMMTKNTGVKRESFDSDSSQSKRKTPNKVGYNVKVELGKVVKKRRRLVKKSEPVIKPSKISPKKSNHSYTLLTDDSSDSSDEQDVINVIKRRKMIARKSDIFRRQIVKVKFQLDESSISKRSKLGLKSNNCNNLPDSIMEESVDKMGNHHNAFHDGSESKVEKVEENAVKSESNENEEETIVKIKPPVSEHLSKKLEEKSVEGMEEKPADFVNSTTACSDTISEKDPQQNAETAVEEPESQVEKESASVSEEFVPSGVLEESKSIDNDFVPSDGEVLDKEKKIKIKGMKKANVKDQRKVPPLRIKLSLVNRTSKKRKTDSGSSSEVETKIMKREIEEAERRASIEEEVAPVIEEDQDNSDTKQYMNSEVEQVKVSSPTPESVATTGLDQNFGETLYDVVKTQHESKLVSENDDSKYSSMDPPGILPPKKKTARMGGMWSPKKIPVISKYPTPFLPLVSQEKISKAARDQSIYLTMQKLLNGALILDQRPKKQEWMFGTKVSKGEENLQLPLDVTRRLQTIQQRHSHPMPPQHSRRRILIPKGTRLKPCYVRLVRLNIRSHTVRVRRRREDR